MHRMTQTSPVARSKGVQEGGCPFQHEMKGSSLDRRFYARYKVQACRNRRCEMQVPGRAWVGVVNRDIASGLFSSFRSHLL